MEPAKVKNQEESQVKTPGEPYEYDMIQSLFSYDSQTFLELALGESGNSYHRINKDENVNILDYKQFPLVTSLYDSHLKQPLENKISDIEPSISSTTNAPSIALTEPIVKGTRYKKVVVRINDLQKAKPVAPKLVSKLPPKSNGNLSVISTDSMVNLNTLRNSKMSGLEPISQSFHNIGEAVKNEEKISLSTLQKDKVGGSNIALNTIVKENGRPVLAQRPSGKNPYGAYSIAQSIDKLEPEQINFLKLSKHLKEIQQRYPKLRINLNEMTRHLYLFGAPKEVNDVKKRFKILIESLKVNEFKLDSYELALFVKKEAIQEKLLKFIQIFFDNNDRKDAISFCIYNVVINQDLGIYKLIMYANSIDICQMLFKYIIENIRVDYKINLISRSLIEMIQNDDEKWFAFYKKNYQNCIDYALKRYENNFNQIQVLDGTNSNNNRITIEDFDDLTGNYYLSITGFREDVDEFCTEFKKKFPQE